MKSNRHIKPGMFDVLLSVPSHKPFTTADIRNKIGITTSCYYRILKEMKEKGFLISKKKNRIAFVFQLTESGRDVKSALIELRKHKLV